MTFRVALIGYGYWGPKLARNINNSNIFQIDYIIDNSKKNLDKAISLLDVNDRQDFNDFVNSEV
jgi:predicted dehydrogenase